MYETDIIENQFSFIPILLISLSLSQSLLLSMFDMQSINLVRWIVEIWTKWLCIIEKQTDVNYGLLSWFKLRYISM